MGYPVKFNGANLVLKAPPGRDDVSDLHVMRSFTADYGVMPKQED